MANGYVNRLNADPVDGTPQYPALAERLFSLPTLAPGASALNAREGKRLGSGLEWTISADGLTVTVQPGTCVVAAPDAANGPYIVVVPTAVTLTLPARPAAGQYRRSRLVVRVYDEEVAAAATTLREVRVELVNGAAQSVNPPTVPAVPVLSLGLGQILQTSTSATVYATTDTRTWSAGGVGVVYTQAERDALAAYDGLVVYRDDIDVLEARVGGAWLTVGTFGAWKTYTPVWAGTSNPSLGNGSIEGRYSQNGKTVDFSIVLTVGSTTTRGSGNWTFSLPVNARDGLHVVVPAFQLSPNVPLMARGSSAGVGNTLNLYMTSGTSASALDGTNNQSGLTTGTSLRIAGTYEAA